MKKLLFFLSLVLTVISVHAKEKDGKSVTDAGNTSTVVVSDSPGDRAQAAEVPRTKPILDEQGRHVIPGGYVTITEDRLGEVTYQPDDYLRMVRMGANFQVIRIKINLVGGYPGTALNTAYLEKLDSMIRMAREVGMKTFFKMWAGGLGGSGDTIWDNLYHNKDGDADKLLAGWEHLWNRYKDDPWVLGYDLINEPHSGSAEPLHANHELLLPLLRRLADTMHAISPEKWALYQPINENHGLPGVAGPSVPFNEPFGRDRIIYAPHSYNGEAVFQSMMDRYQQEAVNSDAPLMLGEWGQQTYLWADTNLVRQAEYTALYEFSATLMDTRGFGGIKAWFCGSRAPNKKEGKKPFTWAIFSDNDPIGYVERKFITDVIARPRPLVVAGHLEHFDYDFATRILTIELLPDRDLGESEIFIGENRHYPDGFTVFYNGDLVFAYRAGIAPPVKKISNLFQFDPMTQRLVVSGWPGTGKEGILEIKPGI